MARVILRHVFITLACTTIFSDTWPVDSPQLLDPWAEVEMEYCEDGDKLFVQVKKRLVSEGYTTGWKTEVGACWKIEEGMIKKGYCGFE